MRQSTASLGEKIYTLWNCTLLAPVSASRQPRAENPDKLQRMDWGSQCSQPKALMHPCSGLQQLQLSSQCARPSWELRAQPGPADSRGAARAGGYQQTRRDALSERTHRERNPASGTCRLSQTKADLNPGGICKVYQVPQSPACFICSTFFKTGSYFP